MLWSEESKPKKRGREAVYVAAKIMKLIIVCALGDHAWNQVRKDFVSFFSPDILFLMLTLTTYLSQTTSQSLDLSQTLSPSMLLPLTTRRRPFSLAHLEDPSNEPTELQAARNFHFVKRLRMRVGPGKS